MAARRRNSTKRQAGAPTRSRGGFGVWRRRHGDAVQRAARQLRTEPGAAIVTTIVIAISLSLPLFLFSAYTRLHWLGQTVNVDYRATVFLAQEAQAADALRVRDELVATPGVVGVRVIDPATAMADLESVVDLDAFKSVLSTNPLPWSLALRLGPDTDGTALRQAISGLVQVADVELDVTWADRLGALISAVRRTAWVLGVLIAVGVVFIVNNTVRVAVNRRRDEIEVAKLFGATDVFVKRPFVYAGALQGAAGGLLAGLVVMAGAAVVEPAISRLAASYGLGTGPGWFDGVALLTALGGGLVLGAAGAWLAVTLQLREFERQHHG